MGYKVTEVVINMFNTFGKQAECESKPDLVLYRDDFGKGKDGMQVYNL